MGQVPLILGNGRVSRHLQHYFGLLGLPFQLWQRSSPQALGEAVAGCSHSLVALSDDALVPFLEAHPELQQTTVVHFSGSLATPLAWGAHPLMSFTEQLYGLEDYQEIHFVIDQEAPAFEDLLPGLSNPHHRLDSQLKARYHAECVLSGNFTALLWSHFFQVLEGQLGLPRQAALPYLRRVMENLQGERCALSGPLVRGDYRTVERNLEALAGDPYQGVYNSFVRAYQGRKSRRRARSLGLA